MFERRPSPYLCPHSMPDIVINCLPKPFIEQMHSLQSSSTTVFHKQSHLTSAATTLSTLSLALAPKLPNDVYNVICVVCAIMYMVICPVHAFDHVTGMDFALSDRASPYVQLDIIPRG